jgi:sugar lactone lactonase YvrE
MGSAFVRAGLALNRPDYVVRGVRAADFLYGPMAPNGNLARSWRAGRTGPPAFADDIAARGTLALDLFEATGNLSWLDRAVADADDLVARFHSADGLTTTASDSRPHVWTPYNATGSAEPSPVALAALLASRLDALCGRPDLGAVSDALCQSRVALARHAPRAVGAEAIAASRRALGGREVILTGPDTEALRAALHATVDPYRVVAWLPDGPDVRVPASTGRSTSRATAWVCAGSTCLPPVGEAADLAAALRQPLARAAPLPAAPTASARVWAPRERRRDAPADVTLASLCTPEGLAVQGDDLWIADTGAHRIVRYRLDEGADGWPVVVDRRAWGDGVPGLVDGCAPRFQMPRGLAVAGSRVWICDTGNHAIRVLDPENGSVQTVAGTGVEGAPGRVDPARPLETPLRTPWSIAGNADALFVGMATDHRIWILLPAERRFGPWAGDGRRHGADGTLADAGLGTPLALAAGDGWLFALDADAGTLRAIDFESGRVGTVPVAGTPWAGPEGLTVLGGAAFVSVTGADAVVRVDLVDGTSTPVGSGWSGPRGMAVWRDTVLVADSEAHRVVAVRTDGQCRRVG